LQIVVDELLKVRAGGITRSEIQSTKQYALGRFQRSAQTVGGTAAGYAGRYFFDGVIDDYYRVPERIRAVTKQQITDIAESMFSANIWGFGTLGNCGPEFPAELQDQLRVLWQKSSS